MLVITAHTDTGEQVKKPPGQHSRRGRGGGGFLSDLYGCRAVRAASHLSDARGIRMTL